MTGTGTGVGKTAVAAGLLAVLRERGVRAAAFKPVETDWDGPEGSWPPDAACLRDASGLGLHRDEVVPVVLREPLAPLAAARRAGAPIGLAALDRAWRSLESRFPLVVAEGAGGLAVPVTEETDMAGLAARWGLPLLVVAQPGLGTLNHTALTVHYARSRGLRILGIVVNGFPERPSVAEETNPAMLEELTGVPVLGVLRHRSDVDVEAGRWQGMAEEVRQRMGLGPVLTLAQPLSSRTETSR